MNIPLCKVFLMLFLFALVTGCGECGRREISRMSTANGIVKPGMTAHEVKALLGPPTDASDKIFTYMVPRETNANSICILSWLRSRTERNKKWTIIYELTFEKAHPIEQFPGNPVSDLAEREAGWRLKTIWGEVVTDRKLKEWEKMYQSKGRPETLEADKDP